MKPLEAKYSPGPWRVTNYWPRKVYDKGSRLVAVPFLANTGDRTANCSRCGANADLISAAPELLECLKDAVADYGCYGCTVDGKHCLDKETFTCNQEESCPAKRWMAAIRKAEGLK